MNTHRAHSVEGLLSRSEPSRTSRARLPRISFTRRRVNRALDTDTLLAVLRKTTPALFALAEVVGRWVWIEFAQPPAVATRRQLAQLGFHWNHARQAWQHPCGLDRTEAALVDPRRRYGSYFAAERLLARTGLRP